MSKFTKEQLLERIAGLGPLQIQCLPIEVSDENNEKNKQEKREVAA